MLKRKTKEIANGSRKSSLFGQVGSKKVNRRGFLKGSGIAVGGLAAFSFAGGSVTPAAATAVDANLQDKTEDIAFLVRVKNVDFTESCKNYKDDDIDGLKIRIAVE